MGNDHANSFVEAPSAAPDSLPKQVHEVVVLALEEVVALDLTIATHVFAHEDNGRYRVRLASLDGAPVRTRTGFSITVDNDLRALEVADTVLVPGYDRRPQPEVVLEALRRAAARGARLASICTGAFALAAAGLLEGRRATTHWAHAAELARLHRGVTVDAAVLYVDEGQVLTSAGVAAGIDLCLHLIDVDHGREAAVERARHIVAPLHRTGGQAQFIPTAPSGQGVRADAATDGGLAAAMSWASEHLDQKVTIEELARRAVMSERTFCRVFTRSVGMSPHRWLTAQRLRRACQLLEDPGTTIESVALRCGLGTAVNLRKHFRAAYDTTPVAYREAFVGDR